jgi:DNA-directed RNA polymerase subunit beta'
VDTLEGLKENVIVGHLIPAGTGVRDYDRLVVGSREEYDALMAAHSGILRQEEVVEEDKTIE